eukprot:CAMPEP_0172408502 /NCGR_PEP_ID=MMETSP1061-20121228/75890_1 /TAXON_ID=37318 /ORGANISM="Pseudo-nitzschia pungens, Strain cf. pungens" /LENGTH=286 /DNA_ID=CAMNT_0013144637 /DNA_START=322 /DNA_END=1182 /DNA_ORIENTATION=+
MANFGELVLVLGDLHIPERANAIPENFKKMLVPNKMQHVIGTGNIGPEQWNELRALAPNAVTVKGDTDANADANQFHPNPNPNHHQQQQQQQQQQPPPLEEVRVVTVGQFRIGVIHGHQLHTDANADANQFHPNHQQQQQQQQPPPLEEVRVVTVGQFRIGVIHGHQLLPSAVSRDAKARLRRKLGVDILVTGHTHQNDVVVEDGCYYINPGSITGAYSAMTPDATPSFILLAVQGAKLVCYVYEMSKDGEVEVSKSEFTKPVPAPQTAVPAAGGNNPALLQSLLA